MKKILPALTVLTSAIKSGTSSERTPRLISLNELRALDNEPKLAVPGHMFYGLHPTLRLGRPADSDGGSNPRGRGIPTTTVDQYAASFATCYELSSAELPAVFPLIGRFATPDLAFLA